jgi:hypothetical protein
VPDLTPDGRPPRERDRRFGQVDRGDLCPPLPWRVLANDELKRPRMDDWRFGLVNRRQNRAAGDPSARRLRVPYEL